ncbi:MAG: hypothetical protein IJS60_05165 [Abditibacteriota bacterium]|nr:hypothetical protein [Abditibacteriota bacterium]
MKNLFLLIILILLSNLMSFAIDMKDATSTHDYKDKQFTIVNKCPSFFKSTVDYYDYSDKSINSFIKTLDIISESSLNEYKVINYSINNLLLDIKPYVKYAIKIDNPLEYNITIVKNEDIIWDMFYKKTNKHFGVLDIVSTNNGCILLYTDSQSLFINYITKIYEKRICIEYRLPYDLSFIGISSGIKRDYNLKLANIISSNIIRCEFNDGRVEYWLIRDRSRKIPSKSLFGDVSPILNQLIWSNYIGKGSGNEPVVPPELIFKQDTEPTIEQLKEKFPDDTFFR